MPNESTSLDHEHPADDSPAAGCLGPAQASRLLAFLRSLSRVSCLMSQDSQPRLDVSRRSVLKALSVAGGVAATGVASRAANAAPSNGPAHKSTWDKTNDRVFLGGHYWANPMEDWVIRDGAAVCESGGGDRNIHLLTHQLTNAGGSFEMSVTAERLKGGKQDGGVGFKIGTKADINEHRANCFAHNGIMAGVVKGKLTLGPKTAPLPGILGGDLVVLNLKGKPVDGGYELTLTASHPLAKIAPSRVTYVVKPEAVLGNISVVSNLSLPMKQKNGGSYSFRKWSVSGDAFTVDDSRQFGPILWTMYTLSDSRSDDGFVLRLSALTGPLGEQDNKTLQLQIDDGGSWSTVAEDDLHLDAWTAIFEVKNWDESKDHAFRVTYQETLTDGSTTEHEYTGTIKANPSGRPLRMAAMTCQNDYGFPYEPVANNVAKMNADLLFFSGDQLYEGHGGYGLIRKPADRAILNYLRKQYQFGWAFREAMRHAPTVCLTDDHDVFQGNIWGESGAPMTTGEKGASSSGGYIEPPKMVNVVHYTNTVHHPKPFDPTPVQQGITVYYGDLVYGNVSFAILSDRQFKSSPDRVCEWDGRADHIKDPDYDTAKLDKPGLELLGKRQETFLKQWADDWRGHEMKVVLSQTVFAALATHHGGYDGYLRGDLDSGSWPQTPRNRAVDIMRDSKALHINGDQHLATMSQYGTTSQRDANWSFCTPAIAAGYPRWWRADEVGLEHTNRPKHGLPNTGEFVDTFGNLVYVYAVGNPEVPGKVDRYTKAHQKGSGFGFVTIDTAAKTYLCDCYRFLIDLDKLSPADQFPGWPVLIHQAENGGDNRLG